MDIKSKGRAIVEHCPAFPFVFMLDTLKRQPDDREPFALSADLISPGHSSPKATTAPQRSTYFNNKQQPSTDAKRTYGTKRKKRKRLLSEKLINHYKTRLLLSRLYDEIGEKKKAKNLFRCDSFFLVKKCPDGHFIGKKKANFHCQNRLCPTCSARLSNRHFNKYSEIVDAYLTKNPDLTPLHIVLTQKQRQNESVKDAHKRLTKTVNYFLRKPEKTRKNSFWFESFAGSLNKYEFTISRHTYKDGAVHFHCHLLAFCKLPDAKRNKQWLAQFREAWSNASAGENKNLKVIPIKDIKTGLREVLKYICKPADIQQFTPDLLRDVEKMSGAKMLAAKGEFSTFASEFLKAKPIEENEPASDNDPDLCPTCRKVLIEEQCTIQELIISAQEMESLPRGEPPRAGPTFAPTKRF